MTLYLQEQIFSFDHFDIWDEDGNVKYQVDRELFQFGRKLVVTDVQGREICFVQHIFRSPFRARMSWLFRAGACSWTGIFRSFPSVTRSIRLRGRLRAAS